MDLEDRDGVMRKTRAQLLAERHGLSEWVEPEFRVPSADEVFRIRSRLRDCGPVRFCVFQVLPIFSPRPIGVGVGVGDLVLGDGRGGVDGWDVGGVFYPCSIKVGRVRYERDLSPFVWRADNAVYPDIDTAHMQVDLAPPTSYPQSSN